jgi:hypothetical protein
VPGVLRDHGGVRKITMRFDSARRRDGPAQSRAADPMFATTLRPARALLFLSAFLDSGGSAAASRRRGGASPPYRLSARSARSAYSLVRWYRQELYRLSTMFAKNLY